MIVVDISVVQRQLPAPRGVDVDYPRDRSCLVVTWEEVVSPRGLRVYYHVYRAFSPAGAYVRLTDRPVRSNRFEDLTVELNPVLDHWYKVTAVYEDGDRLVEGGFSQPVNFRVHNTDKWMYKINERNMWILMNTGQLFDLYKRLYTGEPCPNCRDTVHGRAGTVECPVCFGTGFVGGYEPAFQLYVRIKPVETALNVSSQMLVHENQPGAWTIVDAKIVNRDLLIGPDGTMYQVLASMTSHAAGKMFHTELRLRALDPMDPLYRMRRATLYPRAIYRELPPSPSAPYLGGAPYVEPRRDIGS